MSLEDNLRVDPRHIGLTGLLSPGVLNCSGARLELFAKNISQPRIPAKGGDVPDIFTGFESIFADYCFDSTKRENEIKIIAIVDKYAIKLSGIRMGSNPMRTVIYRDLKTGEVSYFNISRWTSYTNDFGYENTMLTNLQVNDVITPDTELYSSPAKDGDMYKIGVNANVAFVTTLETTEDCISMSESLARRLAPKSVETRSLNVNLKRYPLNLYGNDEQFRLFPDIGDTVNADGVLCAFRPVRRFSAISDLMPNKLTKVNYIFDQVIYAHPGAKVIDIDVYIGNKNDLPARIYEQVVMYHDAHMEYWRNIVNVYETIQNLPISHKLNTLVTRALSRLVAAKQPVPGLGRQMRATLIDKFNPVTLRIDITLAYQVTVNKGHKTSGREGAKGVIIVKPDEEMPVDEQGFRADICIDPISVMKRTNIIQLYEQYINRVLKWQAMNLDSVGNMHQQFNRIVEVLNDINPEYAKLIVDQHPTDQLKMQYVETCKKDTIKICIPPGMDNLVKEMVLNLEQKYQTPVSPVEFTFNSSTGKRRVKTKDPVMIGTKYIYLLAKYPKPIAPGYGYVNRCHMPVSAKNKNESPIGTQSIRFGESESRIFATAIDIPTILRLKCLFSGSRIGPKYMIDALMDAENPSQLGHVDVSTEELYDDNMSIRIAHHMLQTIGVEAQYSLIEAAEAENLFEELRHIE